MELHHSESIPQIQRIQVALEGESAVRSVKISVERYAEGFGWYAAGSLVFPIHQVPLLQQALGELGGEAVDEVSGEAQIIPFPGLRLAALG